MDLTIRVAGEAGQGVATIGRLLVQTFGRMGLEVLATRSYMSRIRGGLNWTDIRIAEEPVFGPARQADVLVALTDLAKEILGPELKTGGLLLYNGPANAGCISIDLEATAKQTSGDALYANTVAAGAVLALLGYDSKPLEALLEAQFAKKGAQVISANAACARKGAELVAGQSAGPAAPRPGHGPKEVYDGATAIALSAAVSGVKFATAYPMTPSTPTFTWLAGAAEQYGMVVEQAEDEIAAVNMVCGATYAGVPAMTMTSGGGFALMVEGLSLAGMMELPVFIVLGQRPGPATGLPTRTAQQDLLFCLHGGHGEFPRAVFAPGTVRQCYDLTRRSLETAHQYQTPVLLLTDQFLQDMEQSLDRLDPTPRPIDRHILRDPAPGYLRYALTESGVSPRAIPGGPAFVVCDSDEHGCDGHIAEDLDSHIEQQNKRMRKLDGLRADALGPELYGGQEAETLLVAWGSTYGPAREAVDLLRGSGGSVALLHFSQVWPLRAEALKPVLSRPRRVVCVEANQTGQFATLLRSVGALGEGELLTNYSGLPFSGVEIAERMAR